MPNFRRVAAGAAARMAAALLSGLPDGDAIWLGRHLFKDRDAREAKAFATFSKAYYDIFYRNGSGDIVDNGEVALLQRLSGAGLTTALDVGANVGSWTRAMKAACPSIAIHAFEIIPQTAAIMRRAIAGLEHVTLNEVGLGDAAGQVELWFSPGNSVLTSSSADRLAEFPALQGTWQSIQGQVMRGDDYLATHGIGHVDFLKIDVEGMEMKVLAGFKNALARRDIDIVQFEYAPLNRFIPLLLRTFYEFFEPLGFRIGKVYPKGVLFKAYETDDDDFLGLTYIACRSDRADLIDLLRYRSRP